MPVTHVAPKIACLSALHNGLKWACMPALCKECRSCMHACM